MAPDVDPSREYLQMLLAGQDLTEEQAHLLMAEVMHGNVPSHRLAGILVALRLKGESVAEISGLARAMRESAVVIRPRRQHLLDTCGTGGDASGTFNISTATAVVAAAMGCAVAKHGNRSVSSQCGSADVLEALGVSIDLTSEEVARQVDEIGLGFLFAPAFHPSMKHAMAARRELGVRTVFNVLGPLPNPAGAKRQLLGVFSPDLCEPLARVLLSLGSEKAFVVHGAGGLDEVSLLGETRVAGLENGQVRTFTFHPREVGLPLCRAEDLKGGDVQTNAAMVEKVLNGGQGPATDIVVLNAAFAAVLTDRADNFSDGVDLAREKLANGSALAILEQLRTFSPARQDGQ